MKLTDEIEDIRKLEEELGHEAIEVFILSLQRELKLVDYMKDSKPWEAREEEIEDYQFMKTSFKDLKHMHFDRPARQQQNFIGNK